MYKSIEEFVWPFWHVMSKVCVSRQIRVFTPSWSYDVFEILPYQELLSCGMNMSNN